LSVVLADLGGTNLRLSMAGSPNGISHYKISEHSSLDSVLKDFAPDISSLYLASAITPLNGIIEDKRFSDKSHWRINLPALKCSFNLESLTVLNDLEAAAYGLGVLKEDQAIPLIPATVPQVHFEAPPKLLIGVGTGIGHAFLFEKPGLPPFVQRTHGGHIPAFGMTKEQHDTIAQLQTKNGLGRDLIIENIIGGHGLWMLQDMVGKEKALRLFWEFLGLYCNVIVSLTGAYGGVYLTGGIMDDMALDETFDAASFKNYFLRPMVPVVVESLSSTPVFVCHDVNLPILGLSFYHRARA